MQSVERAMTREEARQVNPVVLAFLGDAVYSLSVRERLVKNGEGKAADLQRTASKIVSAKGQSAFLREIESKLTEEESEIFRRGRNAKKGTRAKHASLSDYNRSTGLEAVLGFLYLTGQTNRMEELLSLAREEEFVIVQKSEGLKP